MGGVYLVLQPAQREAAVFEKQPLKNISQRSLWKHTGLKSQVAREIYM